MSSFHLSTCGALWNVECLRLPTHLCLLTASTCGIDPSPPTLPAPPFPTPACSALGFLVFSLTFIIWTRKLADKATASTVTIGDYSVRVRNLPPDVTEQELRKYFEAYGEVCTGCGRCGCVWERR